MSSCRRLLVVAWVGLVGLAGSAAASPESERLFHEGRELLKANKVTEACEAFASSQQLAPAVGTLVNLAMCREQQGQTATAWKLYLEAKQLADTLKDKRGALAMQRIAAIESKLSYLTITVTPAAQIEGLVIKRNGIAVDRAQWNTPVALDPGTYVFEASAPKFTSWSTTQPLAHKAKLEVAIEPLVAEPAPPPEPGGPASDPAVGTPGSGAPDRPGGPPSIVHRKLPSPQRRYVGAGLAFGTDPDEYVYGGRLLGCVPIPFGAVRAIGSVNYARQPDGGLYALGLSADYVWMPLAHLGFGVGLGIGEDRRVQDDGTDLPSTGWWMLRASPVIVRLLEGRVEAGLHVQQVHVSGVSVNIYLLAIDLFPL